MALSPENLVRPPHLSTETIVGSKLQIGGCLSRERDKGVLEEGYTHRFTTPAGEIPSREGLGRDVVRDVFSLQIVGGIIQQTFGTRITTSFNAISWGLEVWDNLDRYTFSLWLNENSPDPLNKNGILTIIPRGTAS